MKKNSFFWTVSYLNRLARCGRRSPKSWVWREWDQSPLTKRPWIPLLRWQRTQPGESSHSRAACWSNGTRRTSLRRNACIQRCACVPVPVTLYQLGSNGPNVCKGSKIIKVWLSYSVYFLISQIRSNWKQQELTAQSWEHFVAKTSNYKILKVVLCPPQAINLYLKVLFVGKTLWLITLSMSISGDKRASGEIYWLFQT